jgi:hypothetical protein
MSIGFPLTNRLGVNINAPINDYRRCGRFEYKYPHSRFDDTNVPCGTAGLTWLAL